VAEGATVSRAIQAVAVAARGDSKIDLRLTNRVCAA